MKDRQRKAMYAKSQNSAFEKRHGMKAGDANRNMQNSMKIRYNFLTDSAQNRVNKFLKGRTINELNEKQTLDLSHLSGGLETDDSKLRIYQQKHPDY